MKTFISYAREDRSHVEQLQKHLEFFKCTSWVDSSLHGGQDWWQVILEQIQQCDVFIPVVSARSLKSVACAREFDWAEALDKPVLPVAVEPPPDGLPLRYSSRHIEDYSVAADRHKAAFSVAEALQQLPPAPSLPEILPERPAAPLSYLTDLNDVVSSPGGALDQDQQWHVIASLRPALRSDDPDERKGGRRILNRFGSRSDLFADVDRMVTDLKRLDDEATEREVAASNPRLVSFVGDTRDRADVTRPESEDGFRQLDLGLPAVLIALAAIVGTVPPAVTLSTEYVYARELWFLADLSRLLLGVAFGVLALKAESFSSKLLMTTGYLMLPVMVLQLMNHWIAYAQEDTQGPVFTLAVKYFYPVLYAFASVIAVVFGRAVYREGRLAWAMLLMSWGVFGLFMTVMSYLARVHDAVPPISDSLLIVQNFLLLVVAVLMYRESRATLRLMNPVRETVTPAT